MRAILAPPKTNYPTPSASGAEISLCLRRETTYYCPLNIQLPHSYPLNTPLPHSYPINTPLPHSYPLNTSLPHSYPLNTPLPYSYPLNTPLSHSYPLNTPLPQSYPLNTPLPHSYPLNTPLPHSYPSTLHYPTPPSSSFPSGLSKICDISNPSYAVAFSGGFQERHTNYEQPTKSKVHVPPAGVFPLYSHKMQ